jgi:hypothetical protein
MIELVAKHSQWPLFLAIPVIHAVEMIRNRLTETEESNKHIYTIVVIIFFFPFKHKFLLNAHLSENMGRNRSKLQVSPKL